MADDSPKDTAVEEDVWQRCARLRLEAQQMRESLQLRMSPGKPQLTLIQGGKQPSQ
jgi:hypothetical protein